MPNNKNNASSKYTVFGAVDSVRQEVNRQMKNFAKSVMFFTTPPPKRNITPSSKSAFKKYEKKPEIPSSKSAFKKYEKNPKIPSSKSAFKKYKK